MKRCTPKTPKFSKLRPRSARAAAKKLNFFSGGSVVSHAGKNRVLPTDFGEFAGQLIGLQLLGVGDSYCMRSLL